jgi:hypothetical protein
MTKSNAKVVVRLFLAATVLALALIDPAHVLSLQSGRAIAQAPDATQKAAFEAAKELGTVEAWNAFLSNYPTGFQADLARAYVKKLAGQSAPAAAPPAAPAPSAYPTPAGSWGGVVRDGPGQNYRKVDSLQEGDPVTLIGPTDVMDNGYPWFRIAYAGGGSGYQWGGILCSIGAERPDLYQTCTNAAQREQKRVSAPQTCRDNGGEWGGDQCWPKGHFAKQAKVNRTGLSCKELKARCSRTDSDSDCKRYLDSCTGHGDN